MKKLLVIWTVTMVIVSCKSKTADNTKVLSSSSDSTEFKEFAKWKKAKEEAVNKQNTVIYKNAPAVGTSTSATNATPKKKGWSKAAKGAVIGGVAGATAGAIINKRAPAVGAVVGGVVGAGVGYEIGRSKDKKDGRN